MNFLVIGYGNTLRSDDGAGQRVAEKLAEWEFPKLRSLKLHQLTPELAADISQADTVIFIDAVATNPEHPVAVQIQELQAAFDNSSLGHSCDPRSLLAMTQMLYGRFPKAYWVLIPAVNFDFGEEFSSLTREGIDIALKQVTQIIMGLAENQN